MIDGDVLPPFENARLTQLRDVLGDDCVATLLTSFEQELRSRPAALRECAQRQDYGGVRRAAHLFRGAALSVGAVDSAGAAEAIERAADDAIGALLDWFDRSVACTLASLAGWRLGQD